MDQVFNRVDTNDVFVAGCYGFNADYFWYPTFRPSTMTLPFIIALASAFIGLHMIITFRCWHHPRSYIFSAMSLLATLDMGSDLFDLFFGLYASKALFWATFTLILIVPVMYFTFAVVVYHRLVPHAAYEWYFGRIISRKYKWNIIWIWYALTSVHTHRLTHSCSPQVKHATRCTIDKQ